MRITRRRFLGAAALAAAAAGAACGGKSPASLGSSRSDGGTGVPVIGTVAPPLTGAGVRAAQSSTTQGSAPSFSNVSEVGPDEVALYFGGKHPNYPGASIANFLGYSPADILESMDTAVLDQVGQSRGQSATVAIHTIVARGLLDSMLAIYGTQPVLLALDAGHGGLAGVYFEPGSNGTEWEHTRSVVGIVEDIATDSRYAGITIRRIFNDAIGDDFGLPPPQDSKARASLVIRNARASMLAYEAGAWNRAHPDSQVAVHVVSVHFNANSGGTLVLHEGDDVPEDFARRSMSYGRDYVDRAHPALNATGLLPSPLGLVNGNGLHDDSLMYAPPVRVGSRVNPLTGNTPHGPPRYAMLQASLLEEDYVQGLLNYRGLA